MKDIVIDESLRFKLAYEIAKMDAAERNAKLSYQEAPEDQPDLKTDRYAATMYRRHELQGALAILTLIGLPDMAKEAEEVRRKITVMI